MKIVIIFLLIFLFILAVAVATLRVVWKVITVILGRMENIFLGKRYNSQEQVIIDVTPKAPMPVHQYTREEKAGMAAQAVAQALAHKTDESAHDALVRLSQIARDSGDKRQQPELARIRQISVELYSIFKKDPANYGYTFPLLARCISGINELAAKGGNADIITGMLYATEHIRDYVIKMRDLAFIGIQAQSEKLAGEISELLGKVERLYWLFLSYPQSGCKHTELVDAMLQSVTEKLQIYVKVTEYGMENSDVKGLLHKAETTVQEMNVALETVLNNILSRDLMQADVELETLRQEMRLRGLY